MRRGETGWGQPMDATPDVPCGGSKGSIRFPLCAGTTGAWAARFNPLGPDLRQTCAGVTETGVTETRRRNGRSRSAWPRPAPCGIWIADLGLPIFIRPFDLLRGVGAPWPHRGDELWGDEFLFVAAAERRSTPPPASR
jgi:hypothetical protein